MADIKDTEIRFIGDEQSYDPDKPQATLPAAREKRAEWRVPDKDEGSVRLKRHRRFNWQKFAMYLITFVAVLLLFALGAVRSCASAPPPDYERQLIEYERAARYSRQDLPATKEIEEIPEGQFEESENIDSDENDLIFNFSVADTAHSGVLVRHLEINGIPMNIFFPLNCIPSLHIGKVSSGNEDILMAFQAADVRKDNGKIVGACVHQGKVVSEGLAKKGFVSLIEGQISLGMTDHSPLFEAAIQHGGDFFRQYPLVADGRLIENNPKNISIRRGICQRRGVIFVAETLVPVSFHDFSQALVDLRVTNAVYLVGSQYACGFYRKLDGELVTWGQESFSRSKNISYIVWRKR